MVLKLGSLWSDLLGHGAAASVVGAHSLARSWLKGQVGEMT